MQTYRERLDFYLDATQEAWHKLQINALHWFRIALQGHSQEYILPSYRRWPRQNFAARRDARLTVVIAAVVILFVISMVTVLSPAANEKLVTPIAATDTAKPVQQPGIIAQTAPAGAAVQPQAKAAPAPPPAKPLLFGMGAQMEGSLRQRLHQEVSLDILTSWYNSPADLTFMKEWQDDIIPQSYANGKSLHLIVWTGDEERSVNTKYGPACGRAYPLSAGFANDMKQLAATFRGSGTLYVSMFTEFQTYPCNDNMWQGSENYYRALQDQYRLAQSIFKQNAPNSQISLTWGGWQADWDDRNRGGGRSLLPYFADVMRTSDFQSFQAMDSRSNLTHINDMTRLLHGYGAPAGKGNVMIAHYKPDNGSDEIWQSDLTNIFTPRNIAQLKQSGLFAFSFMDERNMNASEAHFQQAKQIVQSYGRP